MALTNAKVRELLSAAGVSAENVEDTVKKIMDGHVTSINALREERDAYKADAEKLPSIQKELDEIKAKGDPDWQKKYETEHAAFEEYKTQVADEKVRSQKVELYRSVLKECDIDEKRIPNILKVSGEAIDKLTVIDGKIDGIEALKTSIQNEWSGFIMKKTQKGAEVDNPPDNNGGKDKPEESRAAKIAAEYHKNLYGEMKEGG